MPEKHKLLNEIEVQALIYNTARGEIGEREIPGDADNPRIVEYLNSTTLRGGHDEIPWCSAFVNWCCEKNGIYGSGSARARSWTRWGAEVRPRDASEGDIVVLSRGNNPLLGHVAFFQHWTDAEDKRIEYGSLVVGVRLLGGNQGNMVRSSVYEANRIITIRRYKSMTISGV